METKSHLEPFVLLPPNPNVCQECAGDHPKELPHNKDSLYYQYKFYNENGRWPTWMDAMEHCDDKTTAEWSKALIEMGQKIK